MAHIEWAAVCDLAFFDRQDRLCLIGIVEKLQIPNLPLAISQIMLVARLTDVAPVEELGVAVVVVNPSGSVTTSTSSDCIVVEMAHKYVLVTLREVPLREEGLYRFGLALNDEAPTFVDIPVLAISRPLAAECH